MEPTRVDAILLRKGLEQELEEQLECQRSTVNTIFMWRTLKNRVIHHLVVIDA